MATKVELIVRKWPLEKFSNGGFPVPNHRVPERAYKRDQKHKSPKEKNDN